MENASKRFVLRKDNSLKERVITLGRAGRRHREDFWALRDVSITIKAGTTVGLIGHNGSGKSTLLKLIGGIVDPTSGNVQRRGRLAALLELGAGFHPDLTGRENVYLNASILGLSKVETDAVFDDILAFAGIGDFIDSQVKFYSSGMYVRLAFAVAVHTNPDLLLVDEVLSVGDEAFQRKCLDKIRDFQLEGRTIVLVSHSLGQVQEMCDRAVLLNKGEVMYDGAPGEAVAAFRDVLEERRLAEKEHEPASPSYENGRIHSVVVHARDKAVGAPVEPGDDIAIEVELSHDDGIEEWTLGVQVDNATGMAVFGTASTRIRGVLPPLKERRKITFVLPDSRFGPGKYFINASLLDLGRRHIHDLNQAASFTVPQYRTVRGAVYFDPVVHDSLDDV